MYMRWNGVDAVKFCTIVVVADEHDDNGNA